MLTKKDVKKLATLAKLELTDKELEKYSQDLNTILEYVEKLDSVDTTGLLPTQQVTGLKNVMRKDEIKEQLASPDKLLEIVPKTEKKYIKVGRMV